METCKYLNYSNLIWPVTKYKLPNDSRIEFLLEEYGYDNYLPYTLFYQLIVCSRVGDVWVKTHNILTEFDEMNIELLKSIPYHIYEGSPVEKAIQILQDLSDGVNFRAFERKELFLKDNADNQLDTIEDIEDENIRNAVVKFLFNKNLRVEIPKIFKNLRLIDFTLGTSNKEKEIINRTISNMTSYDQLLKIKPSAFCSPLFGPKFARKKFLVKRKVIDENKGSGKIVILIDNSYSMIKYASKVFSLLYYLYQKEIIVDIHLVNAKFPNSFYNLDKSDLYKSFMNGINFYTGKFSNFTKSIESQLEKYDDHPKEIVIMTDGAENLYTSFNVNSKVTLINVGEKNDQLENLCKLENSNYLSL